MEDSGSSSRLQPDQTVLDEAALSRLKALDPTGNNGLLARVTEAFDLSLSRMLSQLEPGDGAVDLTLVRHVAHTLKSSAASVGGVKLSRLCADLEAQCRAGEVDNLNAQLDELRREALLVLKALKSLVQVP